MLLSGKKNLELSYQNNLNFIFDLETISNPSCTGVFGFQDFNFKVINAKLFDPDDLFIDVVNSGEKIFISGEVSATGYSYILNNVPVALNKNKISNNIKNFFYDFDDGFLELKNLKFLGTFEGLEVFFPQEIIPSGLITGHIINESNENLYLYTGSVEPNNNFNLHQIHTGIYPPNSSGLLVLDFSGFNLTRTEKSFNLDLNLNGSFGDLKKSYVLKRSLESLQDTFFFTSNILYSNLRSDLGANILGENLLYYQFVTGYDQGVPLYGEKELEINLVYSSGYTGIYQSNILGSGIETINFSGKISGAGYLSKNVNIIGTGKKPTDYSNYIDTLNETVYSDLKIASGFINNQKITSIGSGLKNGLFISNDSIPLFLEEEKAIKLSNNIISYGLLTGITSGIGFNSDLDFRGSGIFYYESGDYFTGEYMHSFQNVILTGIYDGNANINYVNTGHYVGNFSGHVTGSGFIYSNNAIYNTTGVISGDLNQRVIARQIQNNLSISHIATGYVDADISFVGFGKATGDYKNTNIYGNIMEFTGIVTSNYSGYIDGTGILIASGTSNLTNEYNETRSTDYIDFISYQATGDPSDPLNPINSVNYTYSCAATGFYLATGLSGILGTATNQVEQLFTGYITRTGNLYNNTGIYYVYSATGLNPVLLGGEFLNFRATGYLKDRSSHYRSTGFTGECQFNSNYQVKFYGLGTGINDGLIYEEDHPRIGYIIKNYQLSTGILFAPQDSGVKTITVTKPAIEFIENGIMPNLIRDFTISPPIVVQGSAFWVPSGILTAAGLPGDAETTTLVIPNSGWTSCLWSSNGSRSYNCGGSTYHTYELESGFNNWFSPPRIKMLTGYITLTGSGLMESTDYVDNITGILYSGSGNMITSRSITGVDFENITGYEKNIFKLRTQIIDNYEYSGIDSRIVRRTGVFSSQTTKAVTGFNFSQIEFTYTGLLSGELNNILINNSSGYLYTGIYLEKEKENIVLNNFTYRNINFDDLNYQLNLTPISNLSGSGFGIIPATGYFEKNDGRTFKSTNIIFDSGRFHVTGFNSPGVISTLIYAPQDSGIKTVSANITGTMLHPRILNQSFAVQPVNNLIGTGLFSGEISGSGYQEKNININNISGNSIVGSALSGNYIDIKPIDFYISGEAISGIIYYNNVVTGASNNVIYTGYLEEITGVQELNFNENKLITGYLLNPLNYTIDFENSYLISTGYYDNIENVVKYKNLQFISGKYYGTGVLPNNIQKLFIQTKIKNYQHPNSIKAELFIAGKTGNYQTSVIDIDYVLPEEN